MTKESILKIRLMLVIILLFSFSCQEKAVIDPHTPMAEQYLTSLTTLREILKQGLWDLQNEKNKHQQGKVFWDKIWKNQVKEEIQERIGEWFIDYKKADLASKSTVDYYQSLDTEERRAFLHLYNRTSNQILILTQQYQLLGLNINQKGEFPMEMLTQEEY